MQTLITNKYQSLYVVQAAYRAEKRRRKLEYKLISQTAPAVANGQACLITAQPQVVVINAGNKSYLVDRISGEQVCKPMPYAFAVKLALKKNNQ